MAFITIEVIPNEQGSRHYDVIIKKGNELLATWGVPDPQTGQSQILSEIKKINKKYNPDLG